MAGWRFVIGALYVALGLAAGCATTDLARPVGRGNTRVGLSAGGPIAVIGSLPIPAPLATVGVAHGVTDSVDVHADLHPFIALYSPGDGSIPILGMDVGMAMHPIPNHRTLLTLGAVAYGFTNRINAVLLTDAWISTGGYVTPWLWLAAGLHNTFRVGTNDPDLASRPFYIPTAFAQVGLRPFTGRVSIELEVRWYAFTQNGNIVAPAYVTIGDLGAIGVLLGVHYQFPGGGP